MTDTTQQTRNGQRRFWFIILGASILVCAPVWGVSPPPPTGWSMTATPPPPPPPPSKAPTMPMSAAMW